MRSPSKLRGQDPGETSTSDGGGPRGGSWQHLGAEQAHGLHEHGALGGSFHPALDRAAVKTAESHGNTRAHPMCRPERSSQGAKIEIRRNLRPLLARHVNGSGRPPPR